MCDVYVSAPEDTCVHSEPIMQPISRHNGRWVSSSLASGIQVIDRLIRSCPSLWSYVLNDSNDCSTLHHEISSISCVAASAMAAPCQIELVRDRLALMRTWRRQLAKLMLKPGIEQRTEAWYLARSGLTTASDVAAAIGGRNGSTKEYLVKKAGGPDEQRPFSGSAPPLKWGIMFEPVANAIYCRRMGVHIHDFGLLHHPSVTHIGASPDGITDMGIMIEIKCPFSRVIDGTIPSAYIAQIQCQLDVCQLDECDFLECQFEEIDKGRVGNRVWDGLECGILVEEWDDISKRYVYHYCPFIGGYTEDEIMIREQWATDIVGNLRASAQADCVIRRWRLKGLNIIRVVRDQAYIEIMNASLATAWTRVLRYRADRDAYRSEVLGFRSVVKSPVAHPFEISGYAFVDE